MLAAATTTDPIREYLTLWAGMIPGADGIPTYLLRHGKGYPVPATFVGGGEPKHCYMNAALDALGNGHTYVEGYVHTVIPIAHAWTLDKDTGAVRELTLTPPVDRVAGYFGVPIKTDYLRKALLKNKVYGLFGGYDPRAVMRFLTTDPRKVVAHLNPGASVPTFETRGESTMTYGTAYFPTKRAANAYYRPYGYDAADVARKIKDGEIHVGKPPLKDGEIAILIDNGTRYAVRENADAAKGVGTALEDLK